MATETHRSIRGAASVSPAWGLHCLGSLRKTHLWKTLASEPSTSAREKHMPCGEGTLLQSHRPPLIRWGQASPPEGLPALPPAGTRSSPWCCASKKQWEGAVGRRQIDLDCESLSSNALFPGAVILNQGDVVP